MFWFMQHRKLMVMQKVTCFTCKYILSRFLTSLIFLEPLWLYAHILETTLFRLTPSKNK